MKKYVASSLLRHSQRYPMKQLGGIFDPIKSGVGNVGTDKKRGMEGKISCSRESDFYDLIRDSVGKVKLYSGLHKYS